MSYWKVGESELLPVMNSSEVSEAGPDEIAIVTFGDAPEEEKVRA